MKMKNLPMRILGWIFFLLSGMFLGIVFFLGRDTVMTITMMVSRNAYMPRFVDRVYLTVFGIAWLMIWIYLEGYYSRAAEKGRLWYAVLRVTGATLVLLFLLTILPQFLATTGVNWAGAGLSTLALLIGAGLLWVAKRPSPPNPLSHKTDGRGGASPVE